MRGGRQRVGDVCRAAPDPRVFDGPVEEESIPPERPAECSAIVVARKFSARARIIKVVGRFEVAIPVIPKGRAVELIRPGLAHHHGLDRKSTRLNSSHLGISYAVFCLKKKTS